MLAFDTSAPSVDWKTVPRPVWRQRPAPSPVPYGRARAGRGRPSSVPARSTARSPREADPVAGHRQPRCAVSGEGIDVEAVKELTGASASPTGPRTTVEPGKSGDERTACGCGGTKGCSCSKAAPPSGSTARSGPSALPSPAPAQPRSGDATIVCDGKGGYRVDLGDWAGAPCGTEGCVVAHENQHIADWKGRWPDGCKGKPDGGQIPLGGPGYDAFLKDSECKAHTVDLHCAQDLLKRATGDCKAKVKDYVDLTANQRKHWC